MLGRQRRETIILGMPWEGDRWRIGTSCFSILFAWGKVVSVLSFPPLRRVYVSLVSLLADVRVVCVYKEQYKKHNSIILSFLYRVNSSLKNRFKKHKEVQRKKK